MANVVYVGNYPTTFTDDDILSIFQDFEGVVLLRSLRKFKKCYSFILCQDQEQVIEIVLSLHDTDVGGRNLIVRASDDELQDIIEECDPEEQCFAEEDVYHEDEQYAYWNSHSPAAATSSLTSFNGSSGYRPPRNPSRLVELNDGESQGRCGVNSNGGNNYKSGKQYYSNEYRSEPSANSVLNHRGDPNRKGHEVSEFEVASHSSYAPSSRSGAVSPASTISSRYSSKSRGEKFSFVSINNFPLGTTEEELEELFADYQPYKIIMRCNTARRDKMPTEAVACFMKSKNATNSIICLDNTVYSGRVLIVTECDDVTVIKELMQVHNLHHNEI